MGLQFACALVIAVLALILSLVFGKDVRVLFVTIGVAIIVVPVLLIFISGTNAILNAGPEYAGVMADATIANIMTFYGENLPGILISEIAGALVGAFGGLAIHAAKSTI